MLELISDSYRDSTKQDSITVVINDAQVFCVRHKANLHLTLD